MYIYIYVNYLWTIVIISTLTIIISPTSPSYHHYNTTKSPTNVEGSTGRSAIFPTHSTATQTLRVQLFGPTERSMLWMCLGVMGFSMGFSEDFRLSWGINHYWLVVWNMAFITFHILGISSSQLTFIFFRGVAQPPTRLDHMISNGNFLH